MFKKDIDPRVRNKILGNLFIHHAISVIINFGWIFNDRRILRIYILFPILTLVHWVTNQNKCYLTQKLNYLCEYTDYQYFHDFSYFLNIKWMSPFYKCFVIAITLYKLFHR